MILTVLGKASNFLVALAIVALLNLAWNTGVPVVGFMKASYISAEGGVVTARVTGVKIRGCDYIKGSSIGWYKGPFGVWHETDFTYVGDLSPDSNRASGWFRQNFGLWQWSGIPSEYQKLRVTTQHDCGGKIRTTIAGTFNAPL